VVVAAADLDIGAELKPGDLKVVDWPQGSAPVGVFTKPDELVGRGVILPIVQNEVVLPAKLASKEAGAGLPPIIPTGLRAVSVRVNEVIGVAGYVLPGTRVDVVATVNPTNQQGDVTTKVILNDVQVLAAGTRLERDGDKNKPITVSVVTMLVDPEQSERLTLAATEGKIQLALRNPLDRTQPNTKGVRPAGLLGSVVPQRPALVARAKSAPAAPQVVPVASDPTVEIIRGDKRAREIVREQ
jgi:pilus assembly protein CpaB